MNITVNGEAKEVSNGLKVPQLLEELAVEMPDMVTVQINGTILDRKDHDTTTVKENDEVEFLYFMGGGTQNPCNFPVLNDPASTGNLRRYG